MQDWRLQDWRQALISFGYHVTSYVPNQVGPKDPWTQICMPLVHLQFSVQGCSDRVSPAEHCNDRTAAWNSFPHAAARLAGLSRYGRWP